MWIRLVWMEAHATAWGYDKFNTPWVMYPFLVGRLTWRRGFSLCDGEISLLGVGTHFAGDFGRWDFAHDAVGLALVEAGLWVLYRAVAYLGITSQPKAGVCIHVGTC